MKNRARFSVAGLVVAASFALPFPLSAQGGKRVWNFDCDVPGKPPNGIYAQWLVDEFAARHPDVVRIGMHVTPPNKPDNIIIASNRSERIGQKSDPEDSEAMKTGKAVVLKEGENFDVTLPLHDVAGKTIGAIGLTFKPRRGERDTGAARRARAMAREIEKRIASKSQLFEPRSRS